MLHLRPWYISSLTWIAFIFAGLITFAVIVMLGDSESSGTITSSMLEAGMNSILLALLTGFFAALLGTTLGVMTTLYDFPFRRFFSVALVLPLAFPVYVFVYIYVGGLEYSGPISTALRSIGVAIPSPRNIFSGSIIFSLCLYPYVFLLVKAQINRVGLKLFYAGKTLGRSNLRSIQEILIPAIKPAILGGSILAMLEVMADFGGVSTLQINTFTVEIYRFWFGLQDYIGGAKLALMLLVFVFLILWGESFYLKRNTYGEISATTFERLEPKRPGLLFAFCTLILTIALLAPFIQLLYWANFSTFFDNAATLDALVNSLLLGLGVAAAVTGISMVLSMGKLYSRRSQPIFDIAASGYAIPGSVIAVGLMLVLSKTLGISITSYGIAGLSLCLVIRFMTPAYRYFNAALLGIKDITIHAAATMNISASKIFQGIYWPAIKPSLIAGFVVVALEVVKEQPATLLLRPVGFETLSTKIYAFTSEGQWELAANPSILLAVLGIFFVMLLAKINR